MEHANIYKKMASLRNQMSKSQHKIADYIVENPHSVPFLTGSKLAKLTNVSEATIVRFATFLGYSGYQALQQQLVESVEKQLNTVERLKMARTVYRGCSKSHQIISGESLRWLVSPLLMYLNAYIPLLETTPPRPSCF